MGQPPGRPRSMNGFEMVTKSKVKITNASNKVNSSQDRPLVYLGGNYRNNNGGYPPFVQIQLCSVLAVSSVSTTGVYGPP